MTPFPEPICFSANTATYALHCPVCRKKVAQILFPWGSRLTTLTPCGHTIDGHALLAEAV